jgi:hypothetical protein
MYLFVNPQSRQAVPTLKWSVVLTGACCAHACVNVTGTVLAPLHMSAIKAQVATGGVVGGAGLLAVNTAAPFLGIDALIGSAEVLVAAVISASLAGMWAHGLTQSLRNDKVAEQVRE